MAKMIISRGPDTPGGVRVTVGLKPGAEGHYFCIYCGEREEALAALEMALNALRAAAPDLPVSAAPPPGRLPENLTETS